MTFLPLKVNTAGVIPIIFASSLMQTPIIISTLAGYNGNGVWRQVLNGLNQDYWCNPNQLVYSIGLLVYIVLTVFFAYFYTSLTFNPLEIANNMKKQGIYPWYTSRQTNQWLSEQGIKCNYICRCSWSCNCGGSAILFQWCIQCVCFLWWNKLNYYCKCSFGNCKADWITDVGTQLQRIPEWLMQSVDESKARALLLSIPIITLKHLMYIVFWI